ncbi:hypothetical protein P154DRAFT_592918, partial [Amniculicola lignicola CBS 123094]
LDYTLKFSDRMANVKAPEEFKKACGNPQSKFPTLQDGGLTLGEKNKLMRKDPAQCAKVQEWIHAAEATFMLHALAILYTRWNTLEAAKPFLPVIGKGLAVNVQSDLDWLESELSKSSRKFVWPTFLQLHLYLHLSALPPLLHNPRSHP